jgi:hypothetical protein
LKKLILTLILIASAAIACFAQTGSAPKLSIGADFGIPTGTVSQVYSSVIGASAKLELPTVTPGLKFMFTAGYSDFMIKSEYSSVFTSASYTQLEAGARYYFIPMIYIEGDFGVSINLNKNYSEQKIGLAYDPAIGINLPINTSSAVDIGFRYDGRVESGGTISQVALRVAYKFNL